MRKAIAVNDENDLECTPPPEYEEIVAIRDNKTAGDYCVGVVVEWVRRTGSDERGGGGGGRREEEDDDNDNNNVVARTYYHHLPRPTYYYRM